MRLLSTGLFGFIFILLLFGSIGPALAGSIDPASGSAADGLVAPRVALPWYLWVNGVQAPLPTELKVPLPPCWATFTVEVTGTTDYNIVIIPLWQKTSSGNLYYDETYTTVGHTAPFNFTVVVEGYPSTILGPFPLDVTAHADDPYNPKGNWFDYSNGAFNQKQTITIITPSSYPPGVSCEHYTTSTTRPPTCPDGQLWNGAQCVCPSGTQWNGQQCATPPPYNWWDCHYWWRGQWSWWCDWRWPWITQEPFDFTLNATPDQQTVKAGQSVTFTVAVTLVSGTSQLVTLSLPNPPTGVSYSFSLASGNPDFTSALKVSIDTTVAVGTQVLTITATGGGKTHSTTVNLDVASNKAESSLSISINPAALKVGESVSVGGALTPSLTTSIELVYTRPDGFEMTKHVTVSGAFSDTFKPDMPGLWFVKARWPGDADHYGSESQPAPYTVEAAPPTPPSFWDIIGGPGTLIAVIAVIIAVVALAKRRSKGKVPAQTKPLGKFCMKCGTTIPVGSGFCPQCGEKTQ
jgi:hypothetical protein